MSLVVCLISKGVETISPKGRMIATILLPLETSIPTAFINLSLLKIIAMDKCQFYSLPIQSTVVWHECVYDDSTCIKRTLRMRSWLSVCFTDAKSKKGSRYTNCSTIIQLSKSAKRISQIIVLMIRWYPLCGFQNLFLSFRYSLGEYPFSLWKSRLKYSWLSYPTILEISLME